MTAAPRIDLMPKHEPMSRKRLGLIGAGILAAGILGGAWLGMRSGPADDETVAAVTTDSVAQDSLGPQRPLVLPANPDDSVEAIRYSVEILAANTAEGANFEMSRHGAQMPGSTVSLVPIGDTEDTWYKVYAGAYADRRRHRSCSLHSGAGAFCLTPRERS